MSNLFPFEKVWPVYLGLGLLTVIFLFVDLVFLSKKDAEPSIRNAIGWSIFWVFLALLFNLGFYLHLSHQSAFPEGVVQELSIQFLSVYVIEKVLALDNLFVFVAIFGFLKIPKTFHHRVLFLGVIGAIAFRAIFIGLGSKVMEHSWLFGVFGALLVYSSLKAWLGSSDSSGSLAKVTRGMGKWIDLSDRQNRFWHRTSAGKWVGTPLLAALVLVELSDVVFAIDSVPVAFSISKEPLIIFSANVFSILGLRSLYSVLAELQERFQNLKVGLQVILLFIGLKMIAHFAWPALEVSPLASVVFVVTVLAISVYTHSENWMKIKAMSKSGG